MNYRNILIKNIYITNLQSRFINYINNIIIVYIINNITM